MKHITYRVFGFHDHCFSHFVFETHYLPVKWKNVFSAGGTAILEHLFSDSVQIPAFEYWNSLHPPLPSLTDRSQPNGWMWRSLKWLRGSTDNARSIAASNCPTNRSLPVRMDSTSCFMRLWFNMPSGSCYVAAP